MNSKTNQKEIKCYWEIIKDNWIIITGAVGSLIAIILIPAFRGVAIKALQAFVLRLGKAIMSMLTAKTLGLAAIWVYAN